MLAVGLGFLAIYFGYRIHGVVGSRAALRKFARINAGSSGGAISAALPESGNVDFGLWSEERIEAYKQSLAKEFDNPVAVLRIQKISLEVPVFDGTDELILNRGVGRIIGTAKPGQRGTIGIAGHRDGFFRGLKDIQIGDRIELATFYGTRIYLVDGIEIVLPDDVRVLQPKERPALTLVTCYPFYFVGHAPHRYIVHASIVEPDASRVREPN